MRARGIYTLRPTDEGERLLPDYEVNVLFVIVAESPREARMYAEERAIDEPDDFWLTTAWSQISKVGLCTNNRVRSGVLASENNAS